jgi:hemoglobin
VEADVADFESALERLIPRFYERVRADPDLGPVFANAVSDWDEHHRQLVAFWSSVILTTGRYKGNPVAMHARHHDRLSPGLFDRWLELWRVTTSELMPPDHAADLQEKAARIAESLKLALFFKIPPARPRAPDHADLIEPKQSHRVTPHDHRSTLDH